MTDDDVFMDAEVKDFVVEAIGRRYKKWASSRRRRIRMWTHEPAVVAYIESTPGHKTMGRMIQRLVDSGQITSPDDVTGNAFLAQRLIDAADIDADECRRVLLISFIDDEIEHLLNEGVIEGVACEDGTVLFRALRSLHP